MSLFDTIKGALGGTLGAAALSALPGVIERIYPGGLNGMLGQLSQSGYGRQVNSWLGRGENEPITTDDLRAVLDNGQVRELATRFGIPAEQMFDLLAKLLPQTVDAHSPNGQLQPPDPADGPHPG